MSSDKDTSTKIETINKNENPNESFCHFEETAPIIKIEPGDGILDLDDVIEGINVKTKALVDEGLQSLKEPINKLAPSENNIISNTRNLVCKGQEAINKIKPGDEILDIDDMIDDNNEKHDFTTETIVFRSNVKSLNEVLASKGLASPNLCPYFRKPYYDNRCTNPFWLGCVHGTKPLDKNGSPNKPEWSKKAKKLEKQQDLHTLTRKQILEIQQCKQNSPLEEMGKQNKNIFLTQNEPKNQQKSSKIDKKFALKHVHQWVLLQKSTGVCVFECRVCSQCFYSTGVF